ncbi:glycine-rich domain-containing protein [Teredinibacter waterburyi]|uniref:glycine-rich domain-containing protein n=1 Tax=Teredinibacter waterburyi TaxID=1500538 RepID=UPI00165FC4E4|nr:hypothetical protein [Teredinibacter waterburyi]
MDEKLLKFEVQSNGDFEIFWNKLTSENSWSLLYAKEAFSEYKKFVWLASVSPSRVVPSTVVDKVWHLHMTFTKSYWLDFCREVLGFDFHHIPSSQTSASKQADKIQYENTLLMYEREFGGKPNERYWPTSKKSRLDLARYGMFALFTTTFLTACSFSSDGKIMMAIKWGVGVYVVYKVIKWLSSSDGPGGRGGHGCSAGCGSSCGGD